MGWIDLGSDVNWEDYHGMWGRKVKGVWWILQFTNLEDVMGEAEAAFYGARFECQVKRLNWLDLPSDKVNSALHSCGLKRTAAGLEDDRGDLIDPLFAEAACVAACVSYGLGAPMHDESDSIRPASVRARARREAEQLWKDEAACTARLERPVNAIGSTAEEYGRGDVMAALYEGRVPGAASDLMRKLSGVP